MHVHCPNCQRLLDVPEEYAGQMMMCPLCKGQFQMPALPPSPAAGTPPPPPLPPEDFNLAGPSAPKKGPPPPPPPERRPAEEIVEMEAAPEPAPGTGPGAGGYRRGIPIRFNPRFLQWLVPVLFILVFVLSFFPWVGVYPGGVKYESQSAWQAAFGSYSLDEELVNALKGKEQIIDPGVSVLMIFYVILLCLTLLLALFSLTLNFLPGLPPALQLFRRYRWLITCSVALLTLLFLIIQLLVAFPLEKNFQAKVDAQITKESAPQKLVEMARGLELSTLHRTAWLKWAFVLHLVAVVGGFLEVWAVRRGNRPYPKLEFTW